MQSTQRCFRRGRKPRGSQGFPRVPICQGQSCHAGMECSVLPGLALYLPPGGRSKGRDEGLFCDGSVTKNIFFYARAVELSQPTAGAFMWTQPFHVCFMQKLDLSIFFVQTKQAIIMSRQSHARTREKPRSDEGSVAARVRVRVLQEPVAVH